MISRRALFFLVVAILCALLLPATPAEFRWVPWGAMGLALFWTIVIGLEDLSKFRSGRPERRR